MPLQWRSFFPLTHLAVVDEFASCAACRGEAVRGRQGLWNLNTDRNCHAENTHIKAEPLHRHNYGACRMPAIKRPCFLAVKTIFTWRSGFPAA